MKNLMLACFLLLGLCSFAYGTETFIAATEDNVAITKDKIEVQQRVVETKEITVNISRTLKGIDSEIAVKAAAIVVIENEIAELQRIRILVDAAAGKVKLKVEK